MSATEYIDNFQNELDEWFRLGEKRNEKLQNNKLFTQKDQKNVEKLLKIFENIKNDKIDIKDVNIKEFSELFNISYKNMIIQETYNKVKAIPYISIEEATWHFRDDLDHWHIKCRSSTKISEKEENDIKKAIKPYSIDHTAWVGNHIFQEESTGLFDLRLKAERYDAPWHMLLRGLVKNPTRCPKCGSIKCSIEKNEFHGEEYHKCYECGEETYEYKIYVM